METLRAATGIRCGGQDQRGENSTERLLRWRSCSVGPRGSGALAVRLRWRMRRSRRRVNARHTAQRASLDARRQRQAHGSATPSVLTLAVHTLAAHRPHTTARLTVTPPRAHHPSPHHPKP